MQFTRLRLSGFKSFVDPTDLMIAPGLTGIVGPNGCGKSNLVEALRWVMGETSAKRMRGAEMDDVIFGGTTDRPARNVAEVTLSLDNTDRTAPAAFNGEDQLEVSRKIERERGSDFRVNGKPTRSRDVQVLFQDNSTGANSPALVSQGRVAALINAKPADRRLLLEDAAGVAGLHSRRREAELRLNAAEGNLSRLEDVIRTMDGQLGSLKRQAKQAGRYRELSDRIRRTEAILLSLQWETADRRLAAAREAHRQADAAVGEAMTVAAAAATAQTEAATHVPPAREKEAAAAAALQRLTLAREQLAAEAKRIEEARVEADRRLAQLSSDLAREAALGDDAAEALTRLQEEAATLGAAQAEEKSTGAAADEALSRAKAVVESLEADLTALTQAIATDEATAQSLARRVAELTQRRNGLAARREQTAAEQTRLAEATAAAEGEATVAAETLAAAERTLAEAREEADRLEADRAAAEPALAETRETFQSAESALAALKAEADGLSRALKGGEVAPGKGPPLIDRIAVEPGAEAALGGAFGDDLTLSDTGDGARRWQVLSPFEAPPPLPAGVAALADRVTEAPPALARALALVGIAADAATALALAGDLHPGQVLVTPAGDRITADGRIALAGAPPAVAVRLEQRNRLEQLTGQIAEAETRAADARSRFDTARTHLASATEAARTARQAADQAYKAATAARDKQAAQAQRAASQRAAQDALSDRLAQIVQDHEEAVAALETALAEQASLPDLAARREQAAHLRRQVAEARGDQAARQAVLDGLQRESKARADRLAAIARERQSWQSRADGAAGRVTELETRRTETQETLQALADRPAAIARDRETLGEKIAEAERARQSAADALALAETAQRDTDAQARQADQALATARERRVAAEAEVKAAHTALEALAERIMERLDCGPEQVARVAGLDREAPPPDPKSVEAQLHRLAGERDALGTVNLRAEEEAAELETQIDALKAEREDLIAAIARLRQGIASLNREAKDRLTVAFDLVQGHFADLFVRLFGGGKAELKLTDPDNPLDCGLEILASPPGKRLQHLSLLSGGEQALTAVALLFAVFLTKPSPICVLDEVDAPLDDANVDRFCTLVEELARQRRTRFLIITHHRMTMARADRLYGVTMMERGISRLVSVDLEAAARLRDDRLI